MTAGAHKKYTDIHDTLRNCMVTMTTKLVGHEDDDTTFVYIVDYPPSRTQSRSIHVRTVRLRSAGGGDCTCVSATQTGLFCVNIVITKEKYSKCPSDVFGT